MSRASIVICQQGRTGGLSSETVNGFSELYQDWPMNEEYWAELRKDFPVLDSYCYLDTANVGPVSKSVAQAANSYYRMSSDYGALSTTQWYAQYDECRRQVAAFLNASAVEVGFVTNTSSAITFAALIFEGQGRVLTAKGEHPSVVTPWLARRYAVDYAEPDCDGVFTRAAYERQISPDTKIIAVSHVRYNDGQVNDLTALGALAREHDLRLVVDATQSAGVLPLDVSSDCDILAFAGFKWLNAGHGSGAIYVRDGLLKEYGLPIAGRRSRLSEDLADIETLTPLPYARAFELGSVNFSSLMAMGASINRVEKIGINKIRERTSCLAKILDTGLQALNLRSYSGGGERDSAPMVFADVPSAEWVYGKMRELGVIATQRKNQIRLAVSWYNNETDIHECLNIMSDVIGKLKL